MNTTTAAQQRAAAKEFADFWKGKGYEKGQTQPFWIGLLRVGRRGKMKDTVLALCILHCALCIPFASARTPEQAASDLFTVTNRILRLEHGDDMLDALPRWAEREGLSADELSGTLVRAAESLRGATNRADRFAYECAVGALGFCGTTNAIPYLESAVREESGSVFDCAMNALVVLTKADAREIAEIRRIVMQDRRGDPGPLYGFYLEMSHVLKWRSLEPDKASAIRSILLDTAAESADWADIADGILCAHVSGYAASAQRKTNLERALASTDAAGRDASRLKKAIESLPSVAEGRTPAAPNPFVEFGPKYAEPSPPPRD
jgi:hypothetical protein